MKNAISMPVRKLKPRNKATAPPMPTTKEQKRLLWDVLNYVDGDCQSHRLSRQSQTRPNVEWLFSGMLSQSSACDRSVSLAGKVRFIVNNWARYQIVNLRFTSLCDTFVMMMVSHKLGQSCWHFSVSYQSDFDRQSIPVTSQTFTFRTA